ncbi:efflux ABC transporter, permease protein [Verrucomicrobiia bacterium DG1235]|nr:efflux ABC transporter, permease protein [Verrucomicrobiae bacterium DG1235]
MNLFRDVKFGLRLLRKNKWISIAALVSLGLCIGGNAAIFTMLNGLILRPLPFHESDKIVEIYNTYPEGGLDKAASNIPLYIDYHDNTDAFSDLALIGGFSGTIIESDTPERIGGMRVTSGFFDVFRVTPELGSFIAEENMISEQHRVIVLAYNYWRERYASAPDVVGESIQIDGEPFEILGVAPRSLEALYPNVRIYTAYAWTPEQAENFPRHLNNSQLLGRLNNNISILNAQQQVDARDEIFYEATPQIQDFLNRTGHKSVVSEHQAERVKSVSSVLYLLQIGALFVLAIGCVNIANLLLIRSNARESEFAIRCAIGARPTAIARQLLIESVLLSMGGALCGGFLAFLGIRLINTYAMDMLPPIQPLALDVPTMLFALGLSVAAGVIVGSVPALRVFRLRLTAGLNQNSRSASASRAAKFTSSALACGQITLAAMLLIGTGLLLLSFSKILSRDLGFDPENITTLQLSLSGADYSDQENVHAFQKRLLDGIRALPGVDKASIAAHVPIVTGYPYNTFNIFGYQMAEGEDQLAALHTWVAPDYFESLGIRIIQGEAFSFTDRETGRRSMVIDKVLADRYYPDENPIGRRLGFVGSNTPEEDWPTVIGVAEKVQHTAIDGIQGAPFMYENIYQGAFRNFRVFIKSGRDSSSLLPEVRETLREIDSAIPIIYFGSLAESIDNSLDNKRAVMLLLGIFAGIAVTLSAVGIYGVLAYRVSQQSREIGTRAAIGASRQQILTYFITRGLIRTTIGIGIALVSASLLGRLMSSMLFDVEPNNLAVYASAASLLFVVSMLASFIPALKASRIQPMEALRIE